MTDTDTYTTAEAIEDFLTTVCQGTNYWSGIVEATTTRVVLTDREENDGKRHTIDTALLTEWATSPRATALAAKYIRNTYQSAAIIGVAALFAGNPEVDWCDVDYDADTADIIAQELIFGKLVYG